MAQASLQYTPVQVLQAARRAEAEGKMDYALQFYRHLVEQHSSSPEAQEAREGLFRIAEWRWGEARVARRQEAANGQQGNHGHQPYTIASSSDYPPESSNRLPQIIAREAAKAAAKDEAAPVFKSRYRVARNIAVLVSGIGWLSAVFGILVAVLGVAGVTSAVSDQVLLGVPVGLLVGMPVAMLGLLLVIAGQVGTAVFESTNATLELLSIERGRLSF
jgi:hypothetical protein